MALDSFVYGLNDVKVSAWNNPESYGTAQDVESVQMYGATLNLESGQLEGDDVITDINARIQAVKVKLRFAFKALEVLNIITGITVTTSTTVSKNMIITRASMPYFAICGRADATEGGGDKWLFVPKCKLMEDVEVKFEKGQYIIPEVSAMAVYEGATYGMMKLINHATAIATCTIPPT